MRQIVILLVFLTLTLLMVSCPLAVSSDSTDLVDIAISSFDSWDKSSEWTIMCYMDGDNDLESYLLTDVEEMSEGLESSDLINVIVLFDRIDGYSDDSSILGSNFTDTRLFRVGADEIVSLEGEEYFEDIGSDLSGEYNMGDVETLKSFIEYCKDYYPADNYCLLFSNHGGGVKGDSNSTSLQGGLGSRSDDELPDKAVCYDYSSLVDGSYDCIYTAEMTDVLDDSHSVDLMVYDACLMGLAEIAYQYRPGVDEEFSTDYIVASAPSVWGYGLPYDLVFERISQYYTGGTGNESTVVDGSSYETQYYDPSTMTAENLGQIIVEEQERDTQQISSYDSQSFALYDLDYVEDVYTELNSWAASTSYDAVDMDTARGMCTFYSESAYAAYYPFYDLYDFASYTSSSDLKTAVDNMVVASFGGSDYESTDINDDDFKEGYEGLGFFFTEGDTYYSNDYATYWAYQWWYTDEDTNDLGFGDYGKLDFCSADDDGDVDGWFELLQSLYNPYDPQDTDDQDSYDAYHPGRY
jgi:clostripain